MDNFVIRIGRVDSERHPDITSRIYTREDLELLLSQISDSKSALELALALHLHIQEALSQ